MRVRCSSTINQVKWDDAQEMYTAVGKEKSRYNVNENTDVLDKNNTNGWNIKVSLEERGFSL
jgi:hypothetical protein